MVNNVDSAQAHGYQYHIQNDTLHIKGIKKQIMDVRKTNTKCNASFFL